MKNLYEIQDELYVVSYEKIEPNNYYITTSNTVAKADIGGTEVANKNKRPKIIITTNKLLIKDGAQAIDNEFLEWFVKNPSCEEIEVNYDKDVFPYGVETAKGWGWYKIIIPKEEPKQETLEEAAENRFGTDMDSIRGSNVYDLNADLKRGFIEGAKWQQERMYSEEEVDKLISDFKHDLRESTSNYVKQNCEGAIFGLERLKQFKKK